MGVVVALLGGLLIVIGGGWRAGGSSAAVQASIALVLAGHPLPAGIPITAADVALVRVPAAEALSPLAHALADVVGRRPVRALPSGVPLSPSMLDRSSTLAAGHRSVRLVLDSASAPSDLDPGTLVDVVAAVPTGDVQDGGGRLLSLAVATVLSATPIPDGGRQGGPSASLAVTLDCDAAGAARVLWAVAFAKALHVLPRPAVSPADIAALPDVSQRDIASP